MSLTLQAYWPLFLLLLLVPLWLQVLSPARRPPGTGALLGLRTATIALLVAALMQPILTTRTRDLATALVLDASASVSPTAMGEALDWIDETASDLPGDVVVIAGGRQPRAVAEPRALRQLEMNATSEDGLDPSATDLEGAVRHAHGALPEGRRRQIVLLSDGNENRGDLRRVARLLASQGTPIHVEPLEARTSSPWVAEAELVVESEALPSAGAPHPLRLQVVASQAGVHRIQITVEGQRPQALEVELAAGANELYTEVVLEKVGEHTVTVSIDDEAPSYAVRAVTRPRHSLLIVDSDGATSGFGRAMRDQGFETDLLPSAELPATRFERYDSIVVSDVDADDLSTQVQTRLARWVERGGNLLVTGGPSVYGEEGYSGSPLERVLPIEFNVEEERREVSLMIALDKSYSMKGEKMELAKEATKAALDVLEDEHRFGVVTFDWNPFDAVPLQVAENRDSMIDAIRRIEASAQTNFYPALESCLRQLSEVESKVKHIILVSDGKTYPDDYESLLGKIREADITVSTVAVGLEADIELLRSIAEWGDGNSYFIQDASRVQKILIDEARGTIEDTVVEGEHGIKIAHAASALRDLDLSTAPTLRGFITTKARESATTLLEVGKDTPLLVVRNVGLGRSTMFTSDLKNRWAASWIGWPDFGRLFAQILRSGHARAPGERKSMLLDVGTDRVGVSVDLLSSTGRRESAATPRVRVTSPTGERTAVELRLAAPGAYRGTVPRRDEPGAHLVELVEQGRTVQARSFFNAPAPESRAFPQRSDLLAEVAELTGGKVSPTAGDLRGALGEGQPRQRELWPWLASIALALYLFDLLLRRTGLFNRLAARTTAVAASFPDASGAHEA